MTFTKDKEGNYLKLKFNAALYDALMVGLYENEKNGKLKVSTSKNENIEKLYELFQSDKDFVKNISQATGNKNSIKYRIDKIKEIFGA